MGPTSEPMSDPCLGICKTQMGPIMMAHMGPRLSQIGPMWVTYLNSCGSNAKVILQNPYMSHLGPISKSATIEILRTLYVAHQEVSSMESPCRLHPTPELLASVHVFARYSPLSASLKSCEVIEGSDFRKLQLLVTMEVRHIISLVGLPQYNGRAEVASRPNEHKLE